jgi:DNA-binding response OmpR family regulator
MQNENIENCDIAKDGLKFGRLFIDTQSKVVKLEDSVINMTRSEYEILLMLAINSNRTFSRKQINDAIHENLESATENAIDVHIANIRKKLGGESCCIFNRPGFGYVFDPRVLLNLDKEPWRKSHPPGRPKN